MIDNEGNFEQVYVSFQPKIQRYLARLIGASEAEDLTQEVFIKVDKALTSFRNESQLSTWIYRIATNVAIDRMRKSSFQRESAKGQLEQGLIVAAPTEIVEKDAGLSAQTLSLEETVIHKEMSDCIRGVIEDLPENYRIVVILSELEGLPNKAIAEILEVSLDVAKVRLHRAKAMLKKELLNYCNFTWDERNEFICDSKGPVEN